MSAPVSAIAGWFGPERAAKDPKPTGGPIPVRHIDQLHQARNTQRSGVANPDGRRLDGAFIYA